MNIVDVVILARKSNIRSPDGYKLTVSHMHIEDLQRFATLVSQAAYKAGYCDGTVIEREACAKAADEAHELMNSSFQGLAAAIRARNTT